MSDPLKLEDYDPDQEIQEQMEAMWQHQELQEALNEYSFDSIQLSIITGETDADLSDYDGS